MVKKQASSFVCSNCGGNFEQWFGRCPDCGQWNTLKSFNAPVPGNNPSGLDTSVSPSRFISLQEAGKGSITRISSGSKEIDRVLGGGFARGSVVLVSGEPGIGKSTLLLSILGSLSKNSVAVAYASAEEDGVHVALRAKRLKLSMQSMLFSSDNQIDALIQGLQLAHKTTPLGVVVFDSLQTLYASGTDTTSGSLSQSKEVLTRIINFAKEEQITCIVVGHVTKEGDIAGPKFLEHMVDTVLFIEGESRSHLRILRSLKNRFGSTQETGFFELGEEGIHEVANPSEYFLDWGEGGPSSVKTTAGEAGRTAVGVREGPRIVFATIEALAVTSHLAFPKRVGKGVDTKRLEVILAILKKHLGLVIDSFDVYVNVSGGLTVRDPLADLGIAAAVYSAIKGYCFPERSLFLGEVGLLGALRKSRDSDSIVKEARRLGFTTFYTPREIAHIRLLKTFS
ncbi:DNA repair protein RadA [Candidatus Roizmanbacteria bacterium CG10_big_fil_rev_8_21_14_0_10_45_7]|uniref:DNA repair protein RadA n=1 Tax=Candidatus Roizmanbacteria bacterium CG10_big_fil_rev_8_21_14_0_10_45_7 TaxID=1974854 RepID=A0A2M8KU44_9BACT|nr:MAG: DNA repair protein RadA [Candidatus Roizmanbacteria bacterium CG10_big_fil_rev_8_21_14_0_10_45_7]